jgi:hypothetical protein
MSQITTDGTVDQLELPVLSAHDRCDLCGAQAYVRVTLESGQLLFCAHHGAKFKDKLAPTALVWEDQTSRLYDAE